MNARRAVTASTLLLASCAQPTITPAAAPVVQSSATAAYAPSVVLSPDAPAASSDQGGVPCGSERCVGALPLCCWNAMSHTGTCVADDATAACPAGWDAEATTILDCTAPRRDCGDGEFCSDFRTQIPARFVCWDADFAEQKSSTFLCTTVADCPTWLGTAARCAPDARLPPSVKMCEW